MSNELIDYAIAEGKESINFHLKNMEAISKDSSVTLSFLFAGGGASLGAAIKFGAGNGGENSAELVWPMAALGCYLFILGGLLVAKCFVARENFSPANEPLNLFQPEYDLYTIKEVELENLDERIKLNRKRNVRTAFWLSFVRYGLLLSPFIFLLAWGLVQV